MLNSRRLTLLAFVLTLLLAPGLSLAGAQPLREIATEQSPFERLLTFAERAWSALTGQTPATGRHVIHKACGIDPNGCTTGGGGGTTNSSGGH